jgi:hypothetical protein
VLLLTNARCVVRKGSAFNSMLTLVNTTAIIAPLFADTDRSGLVWCPTSPRKMNNLSYKHRKATPSVVCTP